MRFRWLTVLATCTVLTACGQAPALRQTTSPAGWMCGATGGGAPQWTAEAGGALKQAGVAPFPWCVRPETVLRDGYVEVRFQPLGGSEDQAGGVVWRWQDGDNYYVARANALENNVSLYYTAQGKRHTLAYADAPVARGVWHTLRVAFSGATISVSLDGKRYITARDEHIRQAGKAGVWTKADSVTLFQAFQAGAGDPDRSVVK